ncbi:GSCFA family [Porphyromonas crevioricanis]|uniref:GSCFA family n=1 Tax=Porphyromonas crevioricanis TaxID=393921 RepID=A0A2X4PM27_9PORP|nr:GSCFA domain-containing protein [Porphyromonas crevioricanis]GAD06961.1 hypothetical protein PORCAN_572 [Porphyromonas crevioricanis JCM 13913]SQH72873.1 GSCFA family [Porphyromonas crevioricanis]
MIELSTPVVLPRYPFRIGYRDCIFFLGSCFSRHIGDYLSELAFPTVVNPFGVLYNPLSMAGAIDRLRQPDPFLSSDLFFYEGRWSSYMHHSSFSHPSVELALEAMNTQLSEAARLLPSCSLLALTFGSARVYHLRESGEVVANCHKLPADRFLRRDVPLQELIDKWSGLVQELLSCYPRLNILLTVSPIRHLGDGATANALSKAKLLLLCNELQTIAPDRVHYFPAFEIMMDELRDYRFYADDLKHPSALAVRIIRERFTDALIEESVREAMSQVRALRLLQNHRPLQPSATDELQQKIEVKRQQIRAKYPYINI